MSPYGLSKRLGGDTSAADAWMEKCVASVQASGKPKLNAILICKSQWAKKQRKGR